MPDPRSRHPVPWITQYATPSLIAAIAYHGHPPADDPNWQASGAPHPGGLRTLVHPPVRHGLPADGPGRPGRPRPSLFTLLDGCLAYGGYAEEPRGRVTGLRLLATSYETCGVTFE